jgi:hypothetical protein
MDSALVQKAAEKFGSGVENIEQLSGGLIHFSYKVDFTAGKSIVLQNINTNTFREPQNLIENHHTLYQFLQEHSASISIPEPLLTITGEKSHTDDWGNFWRATHFRSDCFSRNDPGNVDSARETAGTFAAFTYTFKSLPVESLLPVIPGFHDLEWRYQQLEEAALKADSDRLKETEGLRKELKDRKELVHLYTEIKTSEKYHLRIHHHDCKISNILFDKITSQPSCIVDLDTTMPGYIFSDVGDMIRTMACSRNEEACDFETVFVRKEIFDAILEGYLSEMENDLSDKETEVVRKSGLIMIYMQALRFLTDYLNDDVYYQIKYPKHNLNRAINQFYLLKSMENLLK